MVTGATTDTVTDTPVTAVRLSFSHNDINGTTIKTGDFMLMIDGVHELSTSDAATVGGVKYAIQNIMPLSPADTRLLTKAHCRK